MLNRRMLFQRRTVTGRGEAETERENKNPSEGRKGQKARMLLASFSFLLISLPVTSGERRAFSVIRIRPIKYTVYTPSSKETTVSSPFRFFFSFVFFFFFLILARTANSVWGKFSALRTL